MLLILGSVLQKYVCAQGRYCGKLVASPDLPSQREALVSEALEVCVGLTAMSLWASSLAAGLRPAVAHS